MIKDIQKIRADGKTIDDSMSLGQMLALGWEPCRITAVQWNDGVNPVGLKHEAGMLFNVLPSCELAAVLFNDEVCGRTNHLFVFNSDGSQRCALPNVQQIYGVPEAGRFKWFEPAESSGPNLIQVVFELTKNQATYWLELDAASGRIIGSRQVS